MPITMEDLISQLGPGSPFAPRRRLSNDPGGYYPIGPTEQTRRPSPAPAPASPRAVPGTTDPSLPIIRGAGEQMREERPDLALEDWLNRTYLPPQVKALLRLLLPDLLRRQALQQSKMLDRGPGLIGSVPINPFQQFLSLLRPYDELRGLGGQSPQIGALFNRPMGGTRQRTF